MEGTDPFAGSEKATEPGGVAAGKAEVIWLNDEDEDCLGGHRQRGVYSSIADVLQANRVRASCSRSHYNVIKPYRTLTANLKAAGGGCCIHPLSIYPVAPVLPLCCRGEVR